MSRPRALQVRAWRLSATRTTAIKKTKVMEKPDATLLSFVDVEDLDMLKVLAGVWDVEMQQ